MLMSCEVHISDYFVQFGVPLYLVEQWNTSVRCGLGNAAESRRQSARDATD